MREALKGGRIVGIVITVLLAFYFKWLCKPAFNVHSEGMWWYFILVLFCGTVIMGICENVVDEDFIITSVLLIAMSGVFIIWAIAAFFSSELVNARKYSDLISIETGDFQEDIIQLSDMKEFPLLDIENAQVLGSRAIGSLDRISQMN